jgi:hypothetical protein
MGSFPASPGPTWQETRMGRASNRREGRMCSPRDPADPGDADRLGEMLECVLAEITWPDHFVGVPEGGLQVVREGFQLVLRCWRR